MSDARRSRRIVQASPLAGYRAHRAEIDAAVARVLADGRYVHGVEVAAFEREFAAYLGVRGTVGVASGTDAVELALRGCGIGVGDVVFVPAHTAVATVAAVERAGASPVLVDVDPATFTLAPDALDRAARSVRGPRGARRAVVAVHLYGRPADMPAIAEVAARHEVAVLEDCAHAHGAAIGDRRVGGWSRAAAFSFYPTKNLGALGDGGAVATGDRAVADRVRLLREYGWRGEPLSRIAGFNSRLDELQAAVLRVKLAHLDADNHGRIARAHVYAAELESAGVETPAERGGITHVFHQYVIATRGRDALRAFLAHRGIDTAVHYPVPVHRQPAYRGRVRVAGSLAEAERAARTVVSLPMYPELPMPDVRATARAVRDWARRYAGR